MLPSILPLTVSERRVRLLAGTVHNTEEGVTLKVTDGKNYPLELAHGAPHVAPAKDGVIWKARMRLQSRSTVGNLWKHRNHRATATAVRALLCKHAEPLHPFHPVL